MKKKISSVLSWMLMVSMFLGFFPAVDVLAEPSADGKIAWYLFDELDGTEVPDLSGNGMDATLNGNGEIEEDSERKALNLKGSSYVQLPAGLLEGLTDVTVSSWVYLNSRKGYQRIFDFGNGDSQYIYLLSGGGNDGAKGFAGAMTKGGWSAEETVATQEGSDLEIGVWVHVTYVFSGATGRQTTYVNGEKFAENINTTIKISDIGANAENFIGRSGLSWEDLNSDIKVSDFRVYNKALTIGEIAGIAGVTDESAVETDRDAIYIGNTRTIEFDLNLPTKGKMGSTIIWESDNEDIIATDGKVTQPAPGEPDAIVTLIATISKGSATPVTREFECTVLARLTDQKKVDLDLNMLSIGSANKVINDIDLPLIGDNNSTFTWESSNLDVLANDGKVTRPQNGFGDAVITLTVTATNGTDGEGTRVFNLIVLEEPFVLAFTGFKAMNAITGVGVKPELPTIVEAMYNDYSSRILEVDWDEINPELYGVPGIFEVEGTVVGMDENPVITVTVDTFTLDTTFDVDELSPNELINAIVKATNNGNDDLPVLVIVSLNDADDRMQNVSYISEKVQSGDVEELVAGFKLPEDITGYKVKVFVWDGMDIETSNMQPLSGVVQFSKATGAMTTPTGLTADPDSSFITITWDEVSGATGYDIELDGTIVKDVTSPYVHSGLRFNSKHTYTIRAKNSSGVSAWSLPISATTLQAASNRVVTAFDLQDVQLGESAFTANRDRTVNYLKSVKDDDMLYGFRVTAGLDTKGGRSIGGWDNMDSKLRGHTTGHFLTALAQAYADSGDSELKRRLDYMITSLGECQDALPSRSDDMGGLNNEGYLAAYPEKQFIRLEQFAQYGGGEDDIWAPYYTCHKIMAGLLDVYEIADNEQALEIVTKMGDWIYGRLSQCTQDQLTRMWNIYIAGEYGGMNEVMARLYHITQDENHLATAKYFDNTTLFNAMADDTNILPGMHANQHIPQILGALEIFEQTNDPYYYEIAENFFDIAVNHHVYSNGGTGYGEMFRGVDEIAKWVNEGDKHSETCASYNLLKIARRLFFLNPDPKYMDYYEGGLYNAILASQDQQREGHNITYFIPLNSGGQKGFGNGQTCCAGTGMENHTKYQDSIYFKSVDDSILFVNLYMPSTINWEEKGISITQETEWPSQESTNLTVSGNGELDINLRVPYWAINGFAIKVNGEDQAIDATPGNYVTLSRDWKDGDKIQIDYPFSFRMERTQDDASIFSLFYGPMLMVGKSNQSNYINLTLNTEDLSESITPVAGVPLNFITNDVTLVPMYTASGFRYHTYFKTAN